MQSFMRVKDMRHLLFLEVIAGRGDSPRVDPHAGLARCPRPLPRIAGRATWQELKIGIKGVSPARNGTGGSTSSMLPHRAQYWLKAPRGGGR